MIRFTSALLACVTAGCDLGPVGLGDDVLDDAKVAETSATAHLRGALADGETLTFRQLIERGDGVAFAATPDPSDLLRDTNVRDDERDAAGRAPLSVLSYNVALLDVDLLGFIPYAETPTLALRRSSLANVIFSRGDDVVLLQELWLQPDVEEFLATGEELGYRGFVQDRADHNDGLAVFISDGIIAEGTTPTMEFAAYGSQNGQEYFPGPGIKRGWLSVRFQHPTIGGLRVFDTHMQAFPENWLGRVKQARELGIIMRGAVDSTETADDLVIVGGDFNAGPYYRKATWTVPDGTVQDRWFHNTLSYPVMLAYADMVDLAIMGRRSDLAIDDVTLGNTVVNDAARAEGIPGADAGWCERTPQTTFTATDCNSIYFQQYAGTEYPARLDHIFGRDGDERIVVDSSEIVFTEPQLFDGTEVEPSDHYGIAIEMSVTPRL